MGDALTKGLTAAAVAKTGYDVYQEPTPSGKVAVVVDAGVGYGVATGLGYGAFVATGWGAAALGVGAVVGFGYSVASNYFGWKVTYQDAIISSGKNLADMAKGDTPLSGIGSANAGIGSMAQTGTNGMPSPRSMTPNQFHDMLYGGGYAQPSPPTTPHVNTNGGVSGGQGIAPFNSSHPPTGSGGTNFSHVTSNPPSHPTAGGGTNFSHVTSNPPSHPTAGGGTNFSHVTSNPPSHPTAGGTNFSHVTSNPPSHPTPSHPTPTTTSHPNVHTSNPSTHSSPTHSNNHFGGPHPIVLDLAGTGINISEVTRSNTFIDSDGSGKLHRTAWAGVGSGVLFFDPSGTGAITQKNQYVFTEWDPTAQDDMQALRNAFDSNGDGKLDASDAKFAQFKVMVTNADGTQTAKTLTQLGITSIDLKADTTDITYSDGSAIEGQTTYTKSDGSKGTVAAATLATDAKGYAVVQTTVTDGAGTVTVTSTATDADGSIASVTTSVTTANGSSRTLTYDDNGDGVVDRRQVITKATDGVGTTTELWTNSNGGNIKLSAVQTITSIDGKSITINRDSTGGGWYDQTETRMKAVDGSRIFTITDKNADGSEIRQVATTYSIDGLTKTVSTDLDSNLTADRSVVDTLINNLDGSRSETEITKSNNGTILSKVWTDTSIDGKTQTINEDKNGDGLGDLKTVSAIVKNPDGTSISTINSYSQNGTYIDGKTVTKSADSLSSTTTTDMTGDQVFDRKTVDTMVINADKSRDHNVDVFSGNGTLLSHSRIYLAADQLTKTISVDTDGNGIADYVEQTSRDVPNGNRIITGHYKYDKAGNYINGWSTYTSADGLTVDTYVGHTSNGNVWESSIHDVTVKNADGTSTQSISNYGPQTGVLISKTVIDSSANGLNVTKKTDINADNIFDYSHNDLREVFGDLSTRITVSDYNGNGTLRDQIITNSSADRRTVNITVDANGDGKIDQSESITKANTGIITDLVMSKAINATIINQSQTVTSANGLSVTTSTDIDGNGTWDAVSSTVKSYQIDGNIVVTADNRGGNNTLLNRSTVTTSGNTLTQTVKADVDGNGTFDRITVKNTVLNSDGSGTTNVANQDSTGKITDQQTTTVDRTGLNITTTRDINGDAVTDSTDYDQTTYNANGDIVHIEYTNNANGSLRNKQTTTIFANSKNSDVVIDTNGDGRTNQIQTVRYNADGSTTVAISNYDGNNSLYLGTLQDTTTTTTSGNGLVTKTSWDVDGNGVENRYQLDSLVFNNDGSTTRTVAQHITNGIDITASSNSLTTSGNGLSITTKVDADGNGTTDTTVSDVTQIALDGTRTRTVITTNNDTTVREKQVITLGADQLTKTINFDSDGNGTNELTDLTQTGVDGKVTHTITNYNTTGTKISQFTTVSALNGMSSTWTDDRNGDGLADVLTPSLISIAVDGTQTTTIIDKQQTGATTFLTTDQLTKTESGNGLNITLIEDRNGDGIYELNTTDFTVIGTDAAKTETITVKSNTNIVKDTWANVTSANGLTSSTNVDFNGDGRADFTDTYVMVADSSSTDTKIYKLISTGAVREKIITTLSADHLVTTITEDLNGDGVNDRSRQITDRGDGNVEVLFDDYSQFGTLTNRISLLENANEQYKRVDLGVSLARNGVSLGAVWNTEQISYSATGQTIDTVTYGSPNFGSLITETTTTEANGFNSTTIVDLFGDKVTDETKTYQKVINVDGSTVETFTVKNATAVLVEKDVTTTSANGLRTTLNIDNTGDGLNDRVVDTTKQVDGSVKIINTEFTAGVQSSQLITTVSADKLIVTKAYSNGYSETTTNATHAMGSYNWLASDGTKSAHSYDAAGIDTWTATVGVTNYSAAIDKPSEAEFLAIADRIFDTVLDRDMTDREQETLVKYISDGNLNKTQLINDLLASTEFTTKYKGGNVSGTSVQSQLNLIDQFYLNALGRDPTTYAAVLAKNALYNGTQTLAGLIAKISESSEHIVVGLDHITTNNTVLNLGQLNTIHQTDHTLDSVMANNFVKLLYDALFDRDPTPTELSTYATQLLNGTTAKWDMAQKIMTTGTEFSSKYGAMTNTDFINAIYFNAMGAQPASYEQPTWLSLLNANSIDRAAYVTMIAASIEHDVIGSGRNFTGTAGNDTLTGTDGNDALYGGAGDDLLIAGKGSDLLDGGTGVDTASFASSLGYVYGYVSNTISSSFDGHYSQLLNIENLTGSSFNDTLLGDSNSNTLDGGAGNDYLDGGAGDDTLIGGAGADQMSGGAGLDTASYANSSLGVTVNLNITTAQISNGDASGDTLSGIENLIGSSYNDTLTGDANANTLSGGAGNDILIGGAGADNLNGGAGIDTADYGASTVSVQVNLSILTAQTSTGDASGDLLALVENLTGSAFADTLTGDANANVIDGGAGDDTINGGAGANTLIGGAGNDLFYTGASAEAFDGGSGFDTLYYYTSVAGVNVNLATNVVSGGDAQGDTITGIEYVYGSSIGNNVLIGDVNNNYLAGFAGNDTISGGAGDDTIDAGTGTDLLDGGAGVDILYYWRSTTGVTVNLATNTASGGEATGDTFSNFEGIYGSNTGDDTLVGDANYNVLIGYGGNDWISGGAGADYLDGGIGNDTADYTSSLLGVTVNLNLAAQVSAGDASGDTLLNFESIRGSNTGNDVLYGTTGFNYLFGNGGNDFISGGAGGDYIDGGAGNDTVSFSTSTLGVTVNLNLATAQVSSGDASGVTLIGIENLTGSAFADALTGDINANILIGGDGNDILIGGAGADTLNGGLGVDTADYSGSTSSEHIDLSDPSPQIYAGDANGDVLIGIENIIGSNLGNNITGDSGNNVITGGSGLDFLYGGAGNDFLYGGANNDYLTGGQGGDYIDGGASAYDMAEYTNSSSAVSINLLLGTTSGGDAQGDTLVSIESLTGSNVGSDMLSGDNQDNTIYGLGGDDTINGFAGNDMLFGGAGNDTINAGDGSDQITGGDGADAISGGDGNFDDAIRFTLTSAGITVDLNAGTGLGGEAQGDTYTGIESVYATNSLDVITGNASNNTIQGYAGNDTLSGMGGFDIIYGGDGNDTINGGTGDDYLYGNLGSDTFVFSAGFGKDILWDFAAGTGVVDVMQLSLGTAFDTFAEVMAVATQVGANTVITIDPTDTITLVNVLKTGLVADDFLFV